MKSLHQDEIISTKLKEELINLPSRRKIQSKQLMQSQFSSKRISFQKHQANFQSLNKNKQVSIDKSVLSQAQLQQRSNKRHQTFTRSGSLKNLQLPKNWHNFKLQQEELKEGWPNNVIVVKNELDDLPTLGNQNQKENNIKISENDLIYLHHDIVQNSKIDIKLGTNNANSIAELDENDRQSPSPQLSRKRIMIKRK